MAEPKPKKIPVVKKPRPSVPRKIGGLGSFGLTRKRTRTTSSGLRKGGEQEK